MEQALERNREAEERAARQCGVAGNREYNTGWHTALDLHNLLTVSEAIARAALERKESRGGAFPRRLSGEGAEAVRASSISVIAEGADGCDDS